jgi:hypothetical protein
MVIMRVLSRVRNVLNSRSQNDRKLVKLVTIPPEPDFESSFDRVRESPAPALGAHVIEQVSVAAVPLTFRSDPD